MHVALGRLKPALPHAAPPPGAVTVGTSCWSICPTFSGSVMAPSKALTRAEIGWCESSHGAGADFAASAMLTAENVPMTKPPTAPSVAMTAFFLAHLPLECEMNMTRPPWVIEWVHCSH